MHRHYGVIIKCFLSALILGIVTQLAFTAGFVRWSATQGNDFSANYWMIVKDTWHNDGLTTFLICMASSLIIYLIIRKFTAQQETAEKIITWLIIPITLIYSVIMYPNFSDYL
ncbi:hypothetical protein [Kiloniella sp.]|uniref:hypothetical protein n=1 Tax=Kiloniella sp. TaxID=1938587 RepID=UPI003A959FB9